MSMAKPVTACGICRYAKSLWSWFDTKQHLVNASENLISFQMQVLQHKRKRWMIADLSLKMASVRQCLSFAAGLGKCAMEPGLVHNYGRLKGTNLSLRGSGFERAIDKATGRLDAELEDFIEFCWEYTFQRFSNFQGNHQMQKRTLSSVFLLALAGVSAAAPSGSAQAAKEMVPEYLGKLYTSVSDPVINGDRAEVAAKILDRSCQITLIKHAPSSSNKTGWVVENLNCSK